MVSFIQAFDDAGQSGFNNETNEMDAKHVTTQIEESITHIADVIEGNPHNKDAHFNEINSWTKRVSFRDLKQFILRVFKEART